jgi:hypothetical protein
MDLDLYRFADTQSDKVGKGPAGVNTEKNLVS